MLYPDKYTMIEKPKNDHIVESSDPSKDPTLIKEFNSKLRSMSQMGNTTNNVTSMIDL